MAGFDAGATSYSRTGLVEAAESEIQDRNKRFREFIRSFHRHEQFKYRDQLRDSGMLDVDLEDLGSFDQELMRLLKEEPLTYVPLFEQAAKLVKHGMMVPQPENLEDVPDVQLRVISTAHPTRLRELTGVNVARLIEVPGIITSASKTRPKATVVTIACRQCKTVRRLRVRPGLSGVQIPRTCEAQRAPEGGVQKEKCPLDPFQIVPSRCEYVDHQTLKLQELPEDVPTSEMPRHILLSCDRSLVEMASPGSRVTIVGIYCIFQSRDGKKQSSASVRTPYIRVLGIQVEAGGAGRRQQQFSAAEEAEFRHFGHTANAYEAIARNIAPSIYGHEDIKKAIACLLVGGSRKKLPDGMKLRGDINVLLLGDPSTAKSQLLKFTEKVAPICVYTSGKGSSAAGLTASVVRDAGTGEFYLEGGAMVLADGGVVCIDEFDKMREEDRVAIHEAMEQQTISIAKAGITTVLNSRTSVLAAANPQFGRYDDLKSAVENIDFQSTILSRFDLIFVIKDVREEERDKTIAKHVLALHASAAQTQDIGGVQQQRGGPELSTQQRDNRGGDGGGANKDGVGAGGAGGGAGGAGGGAGGEGAAGGLSEDSEIDLAKLKRFIAYLRAKSHPRLAPDAAEALQNHFVRIRADARERRRENNNEQAIPITIRQLEAIVRLSEAIAKFSLSQLATVDHVNEALRLFKVATLDAAASGIVGETGAPEMMADLRRAEKFITDRVLVGTSVPEAKLIGEMQRDGKLSDGVIRKALSVMLMRQEIEYRANGRLISRKR